MRNRFATGAAAALSLVACLVSVPASAVTVVNGGFETGDFTGWTAVGFNPLNTLDNTGVYAVPFTVPYQGTYSAVFGTTGSAQGLTQALTTIAGATYNLSFALQNEAGFGTSPPPDSAVVKFGGATVLNLQGAPISPWTAYSFTVTATSASTVLGFSFLNDDAFWDLDSVSLTTLTSPVPEPETWALFGLGLVAVGARRRRRSAGR